MSDSADDSPIQHAPIDFTICRLRNTLAKLTPDLTEVDPATQERLLEEAFVLNRLDPTWSEWWYYATKLLPAHRPSSLEGGEIVTPGCLAFRCREE